MRVAVTGASGLIGTALCERLSHGGHTVQRLVRRGTESPGEVRWDPAHGQIDMERLEGVDAIVHLAGEPISTRRWTPEQKRRILDSRAQGTATIAHAVAELATSPVLLSGSAVGYYGDTGDRPTDERGQAGEDFPAEVCLRWERAAKPAVEAGARVAFLRTGIVLSPKGGALGAQLPFFKLGLGGRAGDGRQYMSWISIDDEVGAIEHLLAADVEGPVNLVAPEPVSNAEFTKALGRALHRPTTVVPMLAPRLLYGRELADSLLLTSQRIEPAVLRKAGYRFVHPTLDGALRDLLA